MKDELIKEFEFGGKYKLKNGREALIISWRPVADGFFDSCFELIVVDDRGNFFKIDYEPDSKKIRETHVFRIYSTYAEDTMSNYNE